MSKNKKVKNIGTDGVKICSVGGQALMEGIMMLGPHGMAQVVRNPEGELIIKKSEITLLTKRNKFLGLPLVRGSVTLVDSMRRGMKALYDSAEIAATEEDPDYKPSKFDNWIEKKLGDKAMGVIMTISMIIAVVFSVALFMLLPNFVASILIPSSAPKILYNLCEGIIRMAIFMGYMILIAKMKDIRRVYMYHGAEHKTIHCFEHEDELTVENVRKYSKHHPRCGTAFLFVVMIISILIYSIIPRFSNILLNIGLRILLLPVIAGISYEFNRFAGSHNNAITKVLRAPGMAMQRFTTKEPDDSMIEVAIVALKEALKFEEKYDKMPSYSAVSCDECKASDKPDDSNKSEASDKPEVSGKPECSDKPEDSDMSEKGSEGTL